jgi:hypothetical protein
MNNVMKVLILLNSGTLLVAILKIASGFDVERLAAFFVMLKQAHVKNVLFNAMAVVFVLLQTRTTEDAARRPTNLEDHAKTEIVNKRLDFFCRCEVY